MLASETNRTVRLSLPLSRSAQKVPTNIKKSANKLAAAASELKFSSADPSASTDKVNQLKSKVKLLKQDHRKLVRRSRLNREI